MYEYGLWRDAASQGWNLVQMVMIFIHNTFPVLQIFATVPMIILICASLCPIHQREPGNIMEGKNQTALSEFIILDSPT